MLESYVYLVKIKHDIRLPTILADEREKDNMIITIDTEKH
jgi:hypothetical protein